MVWVIDKLHSHVGFSVRHMMVSTLHGRFTAFRGSMTLDPADFTNSQFEGEVDVASIDTGSPLRDEHLRASDIFDIANYPKIHFRSTQITARSETQYVVNGEITIRGITRSATFNVEFLGTAKNHRGVTVAGVSARGSVNRRDFGMTYNFALETGGVAISDVVQIEVDTELMSLEARSTAA